MDLPIFISSTAVWIATSLVCLVLTNISLLSAEAVGYGDPLVAVRPSFHGIKWAVNFASRCCSSFRFFSFINWALSGRLVILNRKLHLLFVLWICKMLLVMEIDNLVSFLYSSLLFRQCLCYELVQCYCRGRFWRESIYIFF